MTVAAVVSHARAAKPTPRPPTIADMYRDEFEAHRREMAAALANIARLTTVPNIDDDDWVVQVNLATTTIELADAAFVQLDAPAEYGPFHRQMLAASAACAMAARTLRSGLSERDVASIQTAVALMVECSSEVSALGDKRPW